APPAITPDRGVFSSAVTVSIPAAQGADIYYTTDGSTPTTGSTPYTTPFSVSSSKTIKAIAAQSFGTSSVTSSYIQIDPAAVSVSSTGLVSWLKADNGIVLTGGNVSKWLDMSSSRKDAFQQSAGNQPTVVSGAVNGLAAVDFNGSMQYLQLPSGLADFTSGASIFLVTRPTAAPSDARFFDFGSGSTNNNIYLSQPSSTGAALTVFNGSTPSSVTGSNAVTLSQYQILEAIHSGSGTATLYTNGEQTGVGSIGNIPNVTRTGNYIAADNARSIFFQGAIAEILIYNRALSLSER